MANEIQVQPAVELQALPLEFIVAQPLVAAVKAQAVAAETTKAFINAMIDPVTKKPVTVDFSIAYKGTDPTGAPVEKTAAINAPLLSIVPVPHLRIDSLTTHFKYEITQTVKNNSQTEKGVDIGGKAGGFISSWVDFTLKGTVSSKSSEEATMNRSGILEITVHASEAPMPEGLAKVLALLSGSIQATL